MLGKLIKYDFKWMIKQLSPFYILAIVFAIIGRILSGFEETVALSIVKAINNGCLFSMIISSIINMAIRNWVRFRLTVYGDESYLTHTLPVEKRDIFLSKFVLAIISSLVTVAVSVVSLFIAFYTRESWDAILPYIETFGNITHLNMTSTIVAVLLIFYLEILNMIVCGFVGAIIGHKFNNHKIGFSVLFGFVTYTVSQAVVLLGMLIVGILNKDFMITIFKTNTITDFRIMNDLFIVSGITYLLCIIAENIVGIKLLSKGVNVD